LENVKIFCSLILFLLFFCQKLSERSEEHCVDKRENDRHFREVQLQKKRERERAADRNRASQALYSFNLRK
jgi:hypothetical protein